MTPATGTRLVIGNGVCPQQAAAGLRIMLGTVASYV